ncbi:MAG: DUF924 family protein [Xenococcaceae cyanobacterium]
MKQKKIDFVAWTTIIDFWFGRPEDKGYGQLQNFWFTKDKEFDRQVRSRFLETYQQAAKGELIKWQEQALSCLALIIVLDQFPRNMFRDSPSAFATDSQALKISKYAVSKGFDRNLLSVQSWFIYLPFEHSENLADQEIALKLFNNLKDDPDSQASIDYAYRHWEVIKRFGRFPHRNQILGRENTPEEKEFLKQPGSKF